MLPSFGETLRSTSCRGLRLCHSLPFSPVHVLSRGCSLLPHIAPPSLYPPSPPPVITLSNSRLLEHQLQTQKRSYDIEVEAMRGELQSVKEENNRQQQLLAQNLQLPPEARIEASLQHEITRLTNENLVRCCSHRLFHPTGRSMRCHIQLKTYKTHTL